MRITIKQLKSVTGLLAYSDANTLTGVKDKRSLLEGLAGMFMKLEHKKEFTFYNHNVTKSYTIKRNKFISEIKEIFDINSMYELIRYLELILDYNFLGSYSNFLNNNDIKIIEVDSKYYHNVLDMLPNYKRAFIYPKIIADDYYIIQSHGDLVGGFTIKRNGILDGFFGLKSGYGHMIFKIALKYAMDYADGNEIKIFIIGEHLKKFYESFGFLVTDTITFDKHLASDKWDYNRFGTPNLYNMILKG